MHHTASPLRHYIALIEAAEPLKISVWVGGYEGEETALGDLPRNFVFDLDSAFNREEITQAIRAEIRQATGYEPARLRLKRIVS